LPAESIAGDESTAPPVLYVQAIDPSEVLSLKNKPSLVAPQYTCPSPSNAGEEVTKKSPVGTLHLNTPALSKELIFPAVDPI
jgi:hypothetical protein